MDGRAAHQPGLTDRWQHGRCFGVIVLLLAFGTVAGADLVLSDPESDTYDLFAAVAGDDVKIDKNSEVIGNLHAGDRADLKRDTLVDGDVSAVDEIRNQGTITGTATEGAEADTSTTV